MTDNETISTAENASNIDAQFMLETHHVFRHWENLAAKPATDEQLAEIWPPWNALPPDMTPESKLRMLTFDESNIVRSVLSCSAPREPNDHELKTEQRVAFHELRRQFPYLPLDKREFNQSLNLAMNWSRLVHFSQTTLANYQDLVTRQWAFQEADAQAAGRIAIYQAAQEIELTNPGLLKSTNPNVADIARLESRYAAYLKAREEALAALDDILYKVPGMRTGKPLPLAEVALGVPNPPDEVPRYLYIARLDALGICSRERLNEFRRNELPRLSWPQRLKFDRFRRTPHFGKEPYAALRIWLLDNRSIFEHGAFRWQWNDILNAAEERKINCPRTCLKQWAYRNEVRLKIKRGPATLDDSRIVESMPLLSPAPVFGSVLKQPAA